MRLKLFTIIIILSALLGNVVYAQYGPNSSYQELKDYAYELLDEPELDKEAFSQLVNDQAYGYKFVNWLEDAWYSLFFNNPKGSEVLYNDFVMALAIGYERLGQPDDLKPALQKIISRRLKMYHGTKNSNHYAREYAALASIAQLTGDKRLPKLQERLRQSVNKIYLRDGYAFEGPEYGLYSMSILSGYVYFSEDTKIKQKIIDNLNWLASISSVDRYKPPFDDSLPKQLPKKISAFAEVNKYWQPNFNFYNIPSGNTFNNQETILRYDNGTTIWLRHRSKGIEWQGLHRHYSNGDIIMKQGDTWWLVAPGYPGWENKFNTPELHNLAMKKIFYPWRWAWRFLVRKGAQRINYEQGDINRIDLELSGNISRVVESDNDRLVVTDKASGTIKQFWQVNGELLSQQQEGSIVKLIWRNGGKILNQEIEGVYKIEITERKHTGSSKEEILQHIQVMVEGKHIITKFSW